MVEEKLVRRRPNDGPNHFGVPFEAGGPLALGQRTRRSRVSSGTKRSFIAPVIIAKRLFGTRDTQSVPRRRRAFA